MTAIRAGLGLVGEELEARRDICIWIRDGVVESIEGSGSCPQNPLGSPATVALPQPANAHVHSADHLFPEYGVDLGLEELVAPPRGLKHRLLASASREDLTRSTRLFYKLAWRSGTGLILDFRELGGVGCSTAKEAATGIPGLRVIALGRPGPAWPRGCDGVGISSPLDYEEEELSGLTSFKPAMTHVAETLRSRLEGDLELALRHGFTGVVHGVYLDRGDLEDMASRGVGLVLCIRSNMWHRVGVPPLRDVSESGVTVGVGTDNASWIPPDIWEEARAVLFQSRMAGVRDAARWVARALFVGGYRVAGLRPRVVGEGDPAYLLLFEGGWHNLGGARDPYYWVLKRVGAQTLYARVDAGAVSMLGFP